MTYNKHFSKVFFVLLFSLIIFNVLFSVYNVNADYNIEEGDTFYFKVITLHDLSGSNFTYYNAYFDVAFSTDSEITLVVETVLKLTNSTQMKISLVVDDNSSWRTAILSQYIFVNRNWEDLEEEWAPPIYEVYETKKVWGLTSSASGELKVEYVKKDGVLNRFYAYEYPLITAIGIKEILIVRTDVNFEELTFSTGLTWLAILPIFILGVSLIIRYQFKMTKNR